MSNPLRSFGALPGRIGLVLLALLPACADLGASQRRVDFQGVLVGTASAPRPVSWKNNHGAALTVNGVSITPAGAFARVPALAGNQPVPVGGSHASDFVFTPPAAGAYTATARPTLAGAPAGVQVDGVTLTGSGVNWFVTGSADLSLQDGDLVAVLTNNAPMDFGSVNVGATSAPPKRFKVRNRSRTRALTVTLAWAGGAAGGGFAHDGPQPIVLGPRKRKWVHLTFTPAAAGAASDTLLVSATDGTPGARTLAWGGFVVAGTGVAPGGGGGGGDGGDQDGDGH